MTKKRVGVLLIQLGTPDSPKTSDVRRYLGEFLNDPRVIDLPWLGRKLLVNGIIVPFRAPKSAKVYKELFDMSEGISPLISHTEAVVEKLQARFPNDNLTVHMAMRYQNPSMYDVLEGMRKENYDHIVILPLFPQYASATTGSAIDLAMNIIRKWWVVPQVSAINQFWDNEGYIDSVVERAKEFTIEDYDHVLFSYHGLPDRHVDKVYEGSDLCSDQPCETEVNDKNKFCYKATCFATTRLIADKVVEEQGKKGAKKLLAFSPAFVADCLETLIEIGDEYQELFEELGGEKVQLVPSSNSHDRFIDGLEELVRERL